MIVKRNIKNQMPSFFDTFLSNDEHLNETLSYSKPDFNIYETEENFIIEIAIPGMKKEDFKIELNNNILSISSEKEEIDNNKDKKFYQRSFRYGKFKSSYALSNHVNKEEISANYEDGILKLDIKKIKEETESKQIEVK